MLFKIPEADQFAISEDVEELKTQIIQGFQRQEKGCEPGTLKIDVKS